MKIILAHNHYQQLGGEDNIFEQESKILQMNGHTVFQFTVHNDDIKTMSSLDIARKTIWNAQTYSLIKQLILKEKPDVIHFHNTFPLISPSVYYAAQEYHLPVVQTLHNYRLLCLNAQLLRNGNICEKCVNRAIPFPGIFYRCYRGSLSASSVVAAMLVYHRFRNTYLSKVNKFIASSHFSREVFIRSGLPGSKIVVKPNFLSFDPGHSVHHQGEYALFVGRLSKEKGGQVLLQAWEEVGNRIPLLIVGTGPEEHSLKSQSNGCIRFLGKLPQAQVLDTMRRAKFLIMPAIWYEIQPLTLVEAYACGIPIIGSRLGSLKEQIIDNETGLHVVPGDPIDLAHKVVWLNEHPTECEKMGVSARAKFEKDYSSSVHYEQIMNIYHEAIIE